MNTHPIHTRVRRLLLQCLFIAAASCGLASRLFAADPNALTGAAFVAAGASHTCAAMAVREPDSNSPEPVVYCWGANTYGQLGDGTTTRALAPVRVRGLTIGSLFTHLDSITAGSDHTCVVLRAGPEPLREVRCWGRNDFGQLGDGTTTHRTIPVTTATSASEGLLRQVTSSATAHHTCVLTSGRLTGTEYSDVACWGRNQSNQVNRQPGDRHTAVRIDVSSEDPDRLSSSVLVGGAHTCMVTGQGRLKCWGDNTHGQLGLGDKLPRASPTLAITAIAAVSYASAGHAHTCAVVSGTSSLECWGSNEGGNLGAGRTDADLALPQLVGPDYLEVVAGGGHTCGYLNTRALHCWGLNYAGQLGLGDTQDRNRPTPVTALAADLPLSFNARQVALGSAHTCIILSDGANTVQCWGLNTAGQLGNPLGLGDQVASPVSVLRGNSVAPDSTPDAFAFAAKNVTFGGVRVVSNAVRITGINVATGIGVSNGTYSVGCTNTFTDSPGTIRNGELVCVQHTGGVLPGVQITTTLTIGGVSATFTSTAVEPVNLSLAPAAVDFGSVAIGSESAPRTFTLTNSGTAATSITAITVPDGFLQTTTCGTSIARGASCEIRVRTRADLLLRPYSGALQVVTSGGTFTAGLSAVAVTPSLTLTPSSEIQFGTQLVGGQSTVRPLTLRNSGAAGDVVIQSVSGFGPFLRSGNCDGARLAPGASCVVSVQFAPTSVGTATGQVRFTLDIGSIAIDLAGTGSNDLLSHYYKAILARDSDAGGIAYWQSEVARMQTLGVDAREVFRTLAPTFFASAEYVNRGRSLADFIDDLYLVFFARPSDAGGRAYWLQVAQSGVPPDAVMNAFLISSEFEGFMNQALGSSISTRPEISLVVDFYRVVLARLPDAGGFNFFVGEFRAAQCAASGAESAVNRTAGNISGAFFASEEYAQRGRSNAQFVADLYATFVRRLPDDAGLNYWLAELNANRVSRESVRRAFLSSAEFGARVATLSAAGCQR